MKTVHEIAQMTGISIRTLHHYDSIGLLKPDAVTEAGYRLYGTKSIERLEQILLLRELEFPLKEIAEILDSPGFDREKALSDQIELLKLKIEHLEGILAFARGLQEGKEMQPKVFDNTKAEQYAAEAKKRWGNTEAYKEYEAKQLTPAAEQDAARGLMDIFRKFGEIKTQSPEAGVRLAAELQAYITDHYYTCTREILMGLGQMYAAGGEMTDNIDNAGGEGTARYASDAIAAYCNHK